MEPPSSLPISARKGSAAMATTHLKNFIDGRWVESSSGAAFDDTDPANGDVIATATKSNTADVDKAIEAARTTSRER
jgi:acyl-CoA reductase-like NAD-dependent aldehyde dehydrogenase